MSSNNMAEGVGKKIVEALKQQSDVEIIPVKEEQEDLTNMSSLETPEEEPISEISYSGESFDDVNSRISEYDINDTENPVDVAFNNTLMNFKGVDCNNQSAIEEMELPANVAVLRQLITKIPAGVSKQTGALIIKQTMEALGIPMTNVLQEAQEVQERLTQSVKECQTNVLEYKKQINLLEVQAQKYQRQFAAVNDIISLFIQTN